MWATNGGRVGWTLVITIDAVDRDMIEAVHPARPRWVGPDENPSNENRWIFVLEVSEPRPFRAFAGDGANLASRRCVTSWFDSSEFLGLQGVRHPDERSGGLMGSTVSRLVDRGLARPPRWLPSNVQFETIMGSVAYGVSSDTSDMDVYGWVIPPRDEVFPHLRGEILWLWQAGQALRGVPGAPHHRRRCVGRARAVVRPDDLRDRQVLRAGDGEQPERPRLALHDAPNASSTRPGWATWSATTAVSSCTRGPGRSSKGTLIRSSTRSPSRSRKGHRAELVAAHGYDTKFAYHVVRLIGEVEQILVEQDVDLQRDRELLKAIRRGEWTEVAAPPVVRRQGSATRTDLRREHAPGHAR